MTGPVSSSADGIGEDALLAATGRPRADWFAALDAAGASEWKHPSIAAWLGEQHGVPAWWCQSLTVAYEQARGLRLPGQRADGTFEVSASKTYPSEQQVALDLVVRAVSDALGQGPAGQRREAVYATARWSLGDSGRILATAGPTKDGRTSVSLTHQRLAGPEQVAEARAELRRLLAAAGQ
ncbi:MAG TPA: DUF4287 domain-containing protein [Cryobacterium sp.]|nr:DUF4287 domain-containing protein [Cryobacterium sp.]